MAQIVNTISNRPLAHTVPNVCKLTGYGPTTVWKLIAQGRLEVIRVEGVRRTLVTDASLMRLLALNLLEPPEGSAQYPTPSLSGGQGETQNSDGPSQRIHDAPSDRRNRLRKGVETVPRLRARKRGRPRKSASPPHGIAL